MRLDPHPSDARIYGFNAFTSPFYGSLGDFVSRYGMALDDDLVHNCIKPDDDERVLRAPWPLEQPKTTLYWIAHPAALETLDKLAQAAAHLITSTTDRGRVGQNVADLCDYFIYLGHAIAAVTYAREQGLVKELCTPGQTPIYIATGTLADRILAA